MNWEEIIFDVKYVNVGEDDNIEHYLKASVSDLRYSYDVNSIVKLFKEMKMTHNSSIPLLINAGTTSERALKFIFEVYNKRNISNYIKDYLQSVNARWSYGGKNIIEINDDNVADFEFIHLVWEADISRHFAFEVYSACIGLSIGYGHLEDNIKSFLHISLEGLSYTSMMEVLTGRHYELLEDRNDREIPTLKTTSYEVEMYNKVDTILSLDISQDEMLMVIKDLNLGQSAGAIRNNNGVTLLMNCIEHKLYKVSRNFMDKRYINLEDNKGRNALHYLLFNLDDDINSDNILTLELLLRYQVDVQQEDIYGVSPLELIQNKDELLEYGLDFKCKELVTLIYKIQDYSIQNVLEMLNDHYVNLINIS